MLRLLLAARARLVAAGHVAGLRTGDVGTDQAGEPPVTALRASALNNAQPSASDAGTVDRGSEPVDELIDEEGAFAHGLFAEGAEPVGDLSETSDEFGFVAAPDQVKFLLERSDEVPLHASGR